MSQDDEVSKYTSRMPKSDYLRVRDKSRRMGISVNTAIIQALRAWCDSPDDAAPIPVHRKLSEVIQESLDAMEARLMAVLDPQGLRNVIRVEINLDEVPVSPGILEAFRDVPGFHTGGYLTNAKLGAGEVPAIINPGLDIRMVPTREGQSAHLVRPLTTPVAREWEEAVKLAGAKLGTAQPLKGQEWVLLGHLKRMPRTQVHRHLETLGAVVTSQLTRKTSGVLVGFDCTVERLTAAEIHGTQQWTERQFLHLLKGCGLDVEIPS